MPRQSRPRRDPARSQNPDVPRAIHAAAASKPVMGEYQRVLDEIPALRVQMDKLSATRVDSETTEPWNVRETILDIGRLSAKSIGKWQLALDLNAAILASEQARGASAYEIIRFRYNDARPLIELGRLADAERILLDTQQAYEDQGDIARLQQVLATRALLEDRRGRPQRALELERTVIRLAYVRPGPRDIAISHHQIANYLQKTRSDPVSARAHRLAAAILFQLTGMTHELGVTCRLLAREFRQDADNEHLPCTVEEIIRVAEQTEGVHLDQLITALQPDRQAVTDALTRISRAVAETDLGQDPAIQHQLQQWESVIAATVAAAGADSAALSQLTPVLDQLAQTSDWAALIAVLRRIISGERSNSLFDGLDPIDTAITGQVLTRLTDSPDVPAQEDP